MTDPQPVDATDAEEKPSRAAKGSLALASATALVLVDLALKQAAQSHLDTSVDLGPVSLQLAYNTGISFSLGHTIPAAVIITVTAAITVGIAIACYTLASRLRPLERISLAAILAGAAANLADRIPDGAVTDYLHTGWFPTFNLADIFITLGAAALVLTNLHASKDRAP